MSGRATLIEHLNDGSITVRLTMISTRDPSQPGVTLGLYPPFARPFSDHDEVGRVAQRDLCDRVGFDDLQVQGERFVVSIEFFSRRHNQNATG
jgi:hypothetical protein